MKTAILWLIALLSAKGVAAQAPPSVNDKHLNVVIISVEDFDDSQYQNSLLQTNIKNAAAGLENFFRSNFPGASIRVLRTHEDTTIAHLTEFFRGTFPRLVNGNMTLLFLLSHGEALPALDPRFGSDLRIVASDTIATDLAGKTLSLSADVIGNMNGLRPGSFFFGFIDTCHSGAAKSIGLSFDAALKEALGTKMMLMASTLSDQLAFQASFSRALLNIWNSPVTNSGTSPTSACTVPEVSPSLLRKQIQDILGADFALGPNDGYPSVLLHFNGTICLETFAAQSAIVDLINGTADSYVASFTDSVGHEFRQPIEAHDSVPIRLNRTPYQLAVYRENQQVLAKRVDLGMETVHWEVLGYPEPQQLGLGLERAANAANSVGAASEDIETTAQASYTAYTIAKDAPSAERVARNTNVKIGDAIREAVEIFLRQNRERGYLGVASMSNPDPYPSFALMEREAEVAQTEGDLKRAAVLFANEATALKFWKSPLEAPTATKAYLAYAAAGEFAKAKQVRELHKFSAQTICADCKNLETQAISGNSGSRQLFANIATNKILENFKALMQQPKTF